MCDFMKLAKRMGIRRKYLFLLLLRAPFDAVRTWMLANLLKSVFHCLETGHAHSLPEICMAYGLICAALFLYNGIVWILYAAFSVKTEGSLQEKMFEQILSLPLEQVDGHLSGEWVTKLNSDIQGTVAVMSGPMNLPHLAVAVINTIFSSFLMFRSSPLFLCVTWFFIVVQLWMNQRIVLKAIPGLKEEAQNSLSENTSAIKPLITAADAILIYDAAELMLKNCEAGSRKLMKANLKIHVRNACSDMCMHLLGISGYLVILLMGYGLISRGTFAFSDLIYCFQVRGSIMSGMFMLITCLNNIKLNSVCVRRIYHVYEK